MLKKKMLKLSFFKQYTSYQKDDLFESKFCIHLTLYLLELEIEEKKICGWKFDC